MLGVLSHNHLIMKEKGLLIYEKKEGLLDEDPLSGLKGITVEHLISVLTFFDSLKVV